jgi:hypothetical protein
MDAQFPLFTVRIRLPLIPGVYVVVCVCVCVCVCEPSILCVFNIPRSAKRKNFWGGDPSFSFSLLLRLLAIDVFQTQRHTHAHARADCLQIFPPRQERERERADDIIGDSACNSVFGCCFYPSPRESVTTTTTTTLSSMTSDESNKIHKEPAGRQHKYKGSLRLG